VLRECVMLIVLVRECDKSSANMSEGAKNEVV
jgi:hypothetical protein